MNSGIGVLFGDAYHREPTAVQCCWIIGRWQSGLELTRGQMTVIDLMLAGF